MLGLRCFNLRFKQIVGWLVSFTHFLLRLSFFFFFAFPRCRYIYIYLNIQKSLVWVCYYIFFGGVESRGALLVHKIFVNAADGMLSKPPRAKTTVVVLFFGLIPPEV